MEDDMKLTINSRKMGKVTFSRPGTAYIFADLSGDGSCPGTLGNQICRDGQLTGDTISYIGDDLQVFKQTCKNWFKAFLRD